MYVCMCVCVSVCVSVCVCAIPERFPLLAKSECSTQSHTASSWSVHSIWNQLVHEYIYKVKG